MVKKQKSNSRKNFTWNAIGLTLNALNSLFFLIVVRFINDLDIAGIFTYIFSLCVFIYAFIVYYNRSFQVADTKGNFSFNDYLTCRIVTSAIALLFVILFSLINNFSIFELSMFFFLACFRIVEAISDCFYGAIQKKSKLYQTGISLSLKAVFGFIAFFAVDAITNNLILSIIALIITNLIFFIFYDYKKYRQLYSNKIKISLTRLKPIFKVCLPIFIFSALAIYLSNCQKYVLPYFESNEIQAIFGILIMPATILSLIGSYLINPFINYFSHHHKQKNYIRFITSAKKLLTSMIGIGIFFLIICYYIGIPILELIFQLDLSSYQWAFEIIILSSIFYAITMIISSLLTILNENRRQTYIYLLSALTATITAIILIPLFGIFGAIYSFLISSLTLVIPYFILLQLRLHEVKNV